MRSASILPIWMMRAPESPPSPPPPTDGLPEEEEGEEEEAFSRSGRQSWVSVKTRFRFRFKTLSHAESGYVDIDSPQFAPLLLTSTWSAPPGSCCSSVDTRDLHASRDCRSAGIANAFPGPNVRA